MSTHYISLQKKNSILMHIKHFYYYGKCFKRCFSSNHFFAFLLFCTSS